MLVVLGIPLLHMELTIGQYTKRGPIHALAQLCPLLKGMIDSHILSMRAGSGTVLTESIILSHRCRNSIRGHFLHHVHVLQRGHYLGPVLPVQLLPSAASLAELQQHVEHSELYRSGHK